MNSSIKDLLQREAQAVLNIPVTDGYEKAVNLIVEQVHEKGGKLVTSGMGSHEHCHYILFYRNPFCVFASQ